MLPSICQLKDFVYCSDLQAQQYASNETLVYQLQDAVDVWISRADGILENCEKTRADIHRIRPIDTLWAAEQLNRCRSDCDFYRHFDLDQPLAVIRVLRAKGDTKRISRLEGCITRLKTNYDLLGETTALFNDFAALFSTPWTSDALADLVQPLLSYARAHWFCDPIFGRSHPKTFQALLECIIQKTHDTVTEQCTPLIRQAFDDPRRAAPSRAVILDAQDGLVTLQEGLCDLLTCTGADGERVADHDLFATSDFLFQRLVVALEILDLVEREPAKCGRIASGLHKIDVLSSSQSTSDILSMVEAFRSAIPESPDTIIQRIEQKASRPMAPPPPRAIATYKRLCITILFGEAHSELIVQGSTLLDRHIVSIREAFVGCFSVWTGPSALPRSLPVARSQASGFVVEVDASPPITEEAEMRVFQQVFNTLEAQGWIMVASHATHDGANVFLFE